MLETLKECAANNYAIVTAQTFGHLAPKPNNIYDGWILFTLTAFGEVCLIDFEFENLDASPWFNIDAIDFVSDWTFKNHKGKNYGIFKWKGTYKKFKNGNSKFKGSFSEIQC